ncbi:MAG: isoprenylcysteine carboxylmethyltransferase family protein [Gemmatimonadaceae bacterium]|nr:isoprenylcysteine carboxylmethyltransferase family protein [Gemmatimonadaceae bacterium]NUQ92413.1 isoprenylcysteine carboxylmethyltransferase family protein [Gemmatimonadaceae bacterium]NUR20521.1 isoprenylcysteine carboxylmethyltransferase family protein [Gemmatimonadaceae bacterium]NUS97357.1 isoprenylcysteine carboxylmethyltransferase family protein [Gemmatimonadaceae bacterium]
MRHVVLFAIFLFAGAGTIHWRRGWVLLAVLLIARILSSEAVARVNADLLAEREKLPLQRGQPLFDRALLPGFMAAMAALVACTAADVWRWHLLPQPGRALAALGMAIFLAGWWIITLALRTNAFAVTVVRHQPERGHAVVERGLYGRVRHPMYAGLVLELLGIPLWLGSTAGILMAIVPIALLFTRILVEERLLVRSLAGYDAYRARVRSRLIPGIW